jgi:hypothetical protein
LGRATCPRGHGRAGEEQRDPSHASSEPAAAPLLMPSLAKPVVGIEKRLHRIRNGTTP